MTPALRPSPDVDQLAELERLRGCLDRLRGLAFLHAGRPANLDPMEPLARGLESFAVIVRTCDQVAAEAGANDDPAAEAARLQTALKRIRSVALTMAGPAHITVTPGMVDVRRDAFAGIARAVDAALDVRAGDVIVTLLDRRR